MIGRRVAYRVVVGRLAEIYHLEEWENSVKTDLQ
jgi:hypothetical protein